MGRSTVFFLLLYFLPLFLLPSFSYLSFIPPSPSLLSFLSFFFLPSFILLSLSHFLPFSENLSGKIILNSKTWFYFFSTRLFWKKPWLCYLYDTNTSYQAPVNFAFENLQITCFILTMKNSLGTKDYLRHNAYKMCYASEHLIHLHLK